MLLFLVRMPKPAYAHYPLLTCPPPITPAGHGWTARPPLPSVNGRLQAFCASNVTTAVPSSTRYTQHAQRNTSAKPVRLL